MVPVEMIDRLNEIRQEFIAALSKVDAIQSFQSLLRNSRALKEDYERFQTRVPEKLRSPFDHKFVCAIVGASGHGKTTILDELFPDLSERGWLVTDVTDTTSQSLRISFAEENSNELEEVQVHSWDIGQLKELFSDEDVQDQNEKDGIVVCFNEDSVDVDGTQASFSNKDMRNFKFDRNLRLRPFRMPYVVPEDRRKDHAFIRALTIKEQSDKIGNTPLFHADGQSYNSLQLRAIVKDVRLRDNFSELRKWCPEDEIKDLVFVDTPGLATSGNMKDEVLKHGLEVKSSHIVLDLLKNDELDILIHLVLCGRQSNFSSLWKALEKHYGNIEMEDLAERTVLAVNGVNLYFTNKDLKRKQDPKRAVSEGDIFSATIEDNILKKMSPRGQFAPADICFLDSHEEVESKHSGLFSSNYKDVYAKYKEKMLGWLKSGSPESETLQRLGLQESFRDNIDAVCDPADRGQGFLVKRVASLISEKGPRLTIKKNLIRSGLMDLNSALAELIGTYYDDRGTLNGVANQEALRSCLSFLDEGDFQSIEVFSKDHIDQEIDKLCQGPSFDDDWVSKSFVQMTKILCGKVLENATVDLQIAKEFETLLTDSLVPQWLEKWGYDKSRIDDPIVTTGRTKVLVQHSLKVHCREILFQLLNNKDVIADQVVLEQDNDDKVAAAEVIGILERCKKQMQEICNEYGVAI